MRYILNYKLFENVAQAKSIVSKKLENYEKLKSLLNKHHGYMGKFTEFLFNTNIPYDDLVNLYNELREISNISSIDINKFNTPEQVTDEIIKIKRQNVINKFINQFPSLQKNIARDLLRRDLYTNLIYNLATSESDLTGLISKISSFKDENSLLSAFKLFDKEAVRSKEDILSHINKNNKSIVVYDDNNILIVRVFDISDILYFGSETAWCIKDNYHWKNYTSGGKSQYILFDYNESEYSKYFKIGFTLRIDGVVHTAHDINDGYVGEKLETLFDNYKIDTTVLITNGRKYMTSGDGEVVKRTSSGTALLSILDNTLDVDITEFIERVYKTVNLNRITSTMSSFLRKSTERLIHAEKKNYTSTQFKNTFLTKLKPDVQNEIISHIEYELITANISLGYPRYWTVEDVDHIISNGDENMITDIVNRNITVEDNKLISKISDEIIEYIKRKKIPLSGVRYLLYDAYLRNDKEKFIEYLTNYDDFGYYLDIPLAVGLKLNFNKFIEIFNTSFIYNKKKEESKYIKYKKFFDFKDSNEYTRVGINDMFIIHKIILDKPDIKLSLEYNPRDKKYDFATIKKYFTPDEDYDKMRVNNEYSFNGGKIIIKT